MLTIIDSLQIIKANYTNSLSKETNKYFFNDSTFNFNSSGDVKAKGNLVYVQTIERLKNIRNYINSQAQRVEFMQDQINSYWVEVYKKYAIPFACIVFVLIGAPLGIMVKKGGFGVAAGISLFFFLLYWACLIGGEKLGNRNMLSPFMGMWIANILIGTAGLILTVKTVKETVTLNLSFLRKIIPKQWQTEEETANENS